MLIRCGDSSLVIDKLCDEAVEGDATVMCFYFDFAARNEQLPVDMLGSLLRQLVGGEREIPVAIAKDFRKEKRAIGGRGLQISGILKMLQTIIAFFLIFYFISCIHCLRYKNSHAALAMA